MAQAFDAISGALKLAGDAVGGLYKLIYGTPGSSMMYPDPEDPDLNELSHARPTGQLWDSIAIPALLLYISQYLDNSSSVWGRILTNATSVAPTLTAGEGVISCTKDEIEGTLTITLQPGFANAYWTPTIHVVAQPSILIIGTVAATYVTFEFQDPDGAGLGVNDLELRFAGIGGL